MEVEQAINNLDDNRVEQSTIQDPIQYRFTVNQECLPKWTKEESEKVQKICLNWAYKACFKGDRCEFYHIHEVKLAIEEMHNQNA